MTDRPAKPIAPGAAPARAITDTHDFAPYVRILGRGPGRSRALSRAEARDALGMILRGAASREQIGALLMLLRYRGETVAEMTGFVEAAQAHAGLPWRFSHKVDVDWPSYADGRTRGQPWYLLAALLLARSGLRIVMHGPLAGPGRRALVAALAGLGITPARDQAQAAAALSAGGFAFLPLEFLHPGLAELLALRGVLGLRSPMNTVGRLLDPAGARASVDGVFHPAYIQLHLGTAALMGRHVAVLKGGGGEAEWSGAKPLALHVSGQEEIWPALAASGQPSSQTTDELLGVWHGTAADPAGEAVVIATAAVALRAIGQGTNPGEHPGAHPGANPGPYLARARALWAERKILNETTKG